MKTPSAIRAAALALCGAAAFAGTAGAAKTQIGEPVEINGMTVGALYIQAVKMDMGPGAKMKMGAKMETGAKMAMKKGDAPAKGSHSQPHHHATSGDLHLEAVVHAAGSNDWGFPEGNWIPYLGVEFRIDKDGSEWSTEGRLMPMAAADGPHYGDNVILSGPGKYHLTYRISPPRPGAFPRHFDKETGVAEWWKPFTVEWDFTFVGTGKKGGY
jgi:uncharacterized protein involved in high-affinity Fe2+ transport